MAGFAAKKRGKAKILGVKDMPARMQLEAAIGLLSRFFKFCTIACDDANKNVELIVFARNKTIYHKHVKQAAKSGAKS